VWAQDGASQPAAAASTPLVQASGTVAVPDAGAPVASVVSTTVVPAAPTVSPSPEALPASAGASQTSSAPSVGTDGMPSMVPMDRISAGDTAWMLTASVLVLLMSLPGLALFYAGMVRKKNILATLAQVLAICSLVTLAWLALGYSWAFMPGDGWLGSTASTWLSTVRFDKAAGLVSVHPLAPTVPESVFVMFQLTFAMITPALIVGAFAERIRFSALLWFILLWSLLVYAPVAHWVWAPG
jgi:Amt family ammonium transporter